VGLIIDATALGLKFNYLFIVVQKHVKREEKNDECVWKYFEEGRDEVEEVTTQVGLLQEGFDLRLRVSQPLKGKKKEVVSSSPKASLI